MADLAQPTTPFKFARFNPAALTRENFHATLEPIARREGKLVLYNTNGNFDAVWREGLIPAFEARYGVRVAYHNVKQAMAQQQLMAVHKAGVPSPVDVYLAGPPDSLATLRAAGVVASLDLAALLPNLEAVPDEFKRSVFGVDTGGSWPIVHRNQTTLVYDSAMLPVAEVPGTFEALLDWARAHPRRLAFTSPAKGGSGSGFLYAAALHFTRDLSCRTNLASRRMTEVVAVRWSTDAACLAPLWRYMTELLKVAELTNGNADTLNLINNRQAIIGTSWEDLVQTFVQDRQLPTTVRQTLLEGGFVRGGDGLIVPANARSPAAALLFVDMAFGHEFQLWKLRHHASRSPRRDIDTATAIGGDAARTMVPASEMQTRSIDADWPMTRALVRAFEDNVLSKL